MGNRWEQKTMLERLEEKFDKCEGCWIWKAAKHGRGYGMFHTGRNKKKGKMEFAHRISYEIYKEMPPDDLVVRHKCDNTSCVNPDHLELGTQLGNIKDIVDRDRMPDPYTTKLSREERKQLIGKGIAYIMSLGYSQSAASRINRGFFKQ